VRLFRTTPGFRKALSKLSPEQKRAAKAAFHIFRSNPFDARLRPHKIQRLSAHYGRAVCAVEIATDLRAAFCVEGQTVWFVSIGTRDIYKMSLRGMVEGQGGLTKMRGRLCVRLPLAVVKSSAGVIAAA
jgi:hypothetical protein